MIQTNISLHQEQHDLIKKKCEETGCSLSWIIREALDEYFASVKKTNPKSTAPEPSVNTGTSVWAEPSVHFPKGDGVSTCEKCGGDYNKFGYCKKCGKKR